MFVIFERVDIKVNPFFIMGRIKKDNQYWSDKENDLMRILLTIEDRNSREYIRAYNELLPKMNLLSEYVLRRYYGGYKIDDGYAKEIIIEGIGAFLIKAKYDENKPNLFSVFGTAQKRFFHTAIVYPTLHNKHQKINKDFDLNDVDTENIIYSHIVTETSDNFDVTERQLMLDAIIKKIDGHIAECDDVIERAAKVNRVVEGGTAKQKRFLLKAKEYFNKFMLETQISALSLCDYILNNTELPEHIVNRYSRRYFNKGSIPSQVDNLIPHKDYAKLRGVPWYLDSYGSNEKYYDKVGVKKKTRIMQNKNRKK